MKCLIKTIINTIITTIKSRQFVVVSGHNYIEEYNNDEKQILICEECGHLSIGYKNVK